MNNLNKAKEAKLQKLLNEQYKWSEGVMSIKEYLEKHPPIGKHSSIYEYSNKRINLEYKKLVKPKIVYNIDITDRSSIEVPKMVYDYYSDLKEPIKHLV